MAKKKSKGRRPAEPLSDEKLFAAARALAGESEKGCTLSACTLLDEALELLLRAKFEADSGLKIDAPKKEGKLIRRLLFEGTMPPLGSFGVRINLCRALGLIAPETFAALHDFREMRNDAAHFYEPFSIEGGVVDSLLERLSDSRRQLVDRISREDKAGRSSRFRLSAAAVYLAMQLEDSADVISGNGSA